MTVKIEKGVPMPTGRRGAERKYPWNEMEVGDSFYAKSVSQGALSSSAHMTGMRLGRKFSMRKEGDGFRVWRTA